MPLDTATIKSMLQLGLIVPDVYVVRHDLLPFTVNESRRWHRMKVAKAEKQWREAGCWESRAAKVPKMRSADIHCVSMLTRMGRDIASEALALKAFMDGAITDAGVMPDDRPPYVRSITFHPPIKDSKAGMAIIIHRKE